MWRRYSKTTRLSWRGDLLEVSLFCRAHAQTTQGLRDPLPNRRRQIGHEGEKGIDRSKVSQIPEGGDRRFSDRAGSLLKLWQGGPPRGRRPPDAGGGSRKGVTKDRECILPANVRDGVERPERTGRIGGVSGDRQMLQRGYAFDPLYGPPRLV